MRNTTNDGIKGSIGIGLSFQSPIHMNRNMQLQYVEITRKQI